MKTSHGRTGGGIGAETPDAGINHRPNASILKTFPNEHPHRDYEVHLHCPEFTSLCPMSGNPDFGVIDIIYTPKNLCIETKSLKQYILAFRSERIFNEHAVNLILNDILAACSPVRAKVVGTFNVRGGISITVTAQHPDPAKPQRGRC